LGVGSGLYGLAVTARNASYDRGWRTIYRAHVPVVSVGNITLGGTGKSPMVEWLARWYRRRDVRVTLISRGYGHSSGINDEGLVLEENLPDVPHLQDPDRVRLAEVAVAELETELIILDDGFQHRRLARDLDLVMLDALDPFGLGWLFPRGLLREPVRSLRRASAIIVSRADLLEPESLHVLLRPVRKAAPVIPIILSRHAPLDLIDAEGQSYPLDELTDREIVAFCGIGNPEGFRRTIVPLHGRLRELKVFPDHHPYNVQDVRELTAWCQSGPANLVLTTQKDLVKLRALTLGPVPLRALRIGLEITEGQEALESILEPLVRGARHSQNPQDAVLS
jgi:tetraacyldisaccharide 4'-kinase